MILVHRGRRVRLVVVNVVHALVRVDVAREDEVDSVHVEDVFHCRAHARLLDLIVVVLVAVVPRGMHRNDDPRRHLAIDRGEVLDKPFVPARASEKEITFARARVCVCVFA